MKGWRRIEIYGLAVLCGTALGSCLSMFGRRLPSAADLFVTAVSAALLPLTFILLIFSIVSLKRGKAWTVPALIAAIMLGSAFCALADGLSDIVTPSWSGRLSAAGPVRRCAAGAGALIDGIPFADRENNALIRALLLGDRSCLSRETVASFRDSGAAHILALSGLHLGIVCLFISRLLKILGNSITAGRLRAALTLAATAFYLILTGAGASICRAYLFILMGECARLCNRKNDLRTILWSSFVCQTALDPSAISSVSFQLSYAAIAGIAYISPLLNRMYDSFTAFFDSGAKTSSSAPSGAPGPASSPALTGIAADTGPAGPRPSVRGRKLLSGRIWESAAVSLSCQVTTAPLAWYHFRTFPLYFLIANLLALPAVGLVIPLSLAVLLLSAAGFCPDFLIAADEALLDYLRWVLRTVAAI